MNLFKLSLAFSGILAAANLFALIVSDPAATFLVKIAFLLFCGASGGGSLSIIIKEVAQAVTEEARKELASSQQP